MVKGELKKLFKNKRFLVLAAILFTANLISIYYYEKYTANFNYVYKNRDEYISFLNGNEIRDLSYLYYEEEIKSQESYLKTYPDFVDNMVGRVDEMMSVSIFSDESSYLYRNLQKSCKDYAKLVNRELEIGNCYGIKEYSNYNLGIFFVLVYSLIMVYFLIFWERDRGIMLLLKVTKNGHNLLAISKWAVLSVMALVYTLLQECAALIFFEYLYGFGNIKRTIQSISVFRNCPYDISLWEGLMLNLCIRAAISVFCTTILYAAAMALKNIFSAVACSGLLFLVEFWFYAFFSISGSADYLKCINLFFCWGISNTLGEYHNLNIFGYPVGKGMCTMVAALFFMAAAMIAGILVFSAAYQVREESCLEHLLRKLRDRFGFLFHHISILFYELFKLIYQQKKWIAILIVLLWCIYESNAVLQPGYYSTAREASYHLYLNRLKGEVTEEKLAFMEEEELYLEGLLRQALEIGENPQGADYLRKIEIESEYKNKEQGFGMLLDQLEHLKNGEGNIYDKFFVDEMAYRLLWFDYDKDLFIWFFGSAILMFLVTGMYTVDAKYKIENLIRTTVNGRRKLEHVRKLCTVYFSLCIYVIMEMPLFLSYLNIDGFSTGAQKLMDFANPVMGSQLPLLLFIIIVFILKAISFLLVSFGGMWIAKKIKSEMISVFIAIGIVGMIAFFMHRLGLDISVILIRNL